MSQIIKQAHLTKLSKASKKTTKIMVYLHKKAMVTRILKNKQIYSLITDIKTLIITQNE